MVPGAGGSGYGCVTGGTTDVGTSEETKVLGKRLLGDGSVARSTCVRCGLQETEEVRKCRKGPVKY